MMLDHSTVYSAFPYKSELTVVIAQKEGPFNSSASRGIEEVADSSQCSWNAAYRYVVYKINNNTTHPYHKYNCLPVLIRIKYKNISTSTHTSSSSPHIRNGGKERVGLKLH